MLPKINLEDSAAWKQRYRAPAIHATQLAVLNPRQGLVADNRTGTLQWHAWDVPTGNLTQITHTPGGHAAMLVLSPDGKWVYHLADEQGNETGHYVRMPVTGGERQDLTPGLPPYSSFGFSVSRSGNRLGFMAAYNDAFHIFCMDIDAEGLPGNLRELYTAPALLFGALLSNDGSVMTVMSTERTGRMQFSLVSFDTATGEKIAELWDGAENNLEMMVASPVPGDARLLASTTKTGIETLVIWNPQTQERVDVDIAGVTGAVRAFDWSPDGRWVIFRTLNSAIHQLYLYDFGSGTAAPLIYPSGTSFQPYFTPDGQEIFSHWQNSTHPTHLLALSTQTRETTRTVISAGEVPPGHEWRSAIFQSLDGQEIQGWLALPDGEGPFPTIIEMHGGPSEVQGNMFLPGAQAWLDHGFAYFNVNYRGSVTFGREFEQKIWGQPGYWEMQDLIAARQWLVEQGIARADQVFLTGWSYGGYLTLLGLGREPGLWAGGIAGVAVSDWALQYEDAIDMLRGFLTAFFGGTPSEKAEQYRASSPITYAENVQAPVLIVQGRNDKRAPARPIEIYAEKLRTMGKAVEVYWFDAGHAGPLASIAEGIHAQELALQFAYRAINGR